MLFTKWVTMCMACLITVAFPVKGPNFISPNGGLNPNKERASSCVIGGRLGEREGGREERGRERGVGGGGGSEGESEGESEGVRE